MAELVGAEKVAVIEGCEVVDVDLSGLGENDKQVKTVCWDSSAKCPPPDPSER